MICYTESRIAVYTCMFGCKVLYKIRICSGVMKGILSIKALDQSEIHNLQVIRLATSD